MVKKGSKKANQSKNRPRAIKGKGDFTDNQNDINLLMDIKDDIMDVKKILHKSEPSSSTTPIGKAASAAGRFIGDRFGLGSLGEAAGSGLAKLFGHGDYSLEKNSLVQGNIQGLKFDSNGRRGVRITEREYIGDIRANGSLVSGATVFDLASYPINPGMSNSFPWLSSVANQFEEWYPHGIVFEFISTSAEYNGTSQALGTVITATDYEDRKSVV